MLFSCVPIECTPSKGLTNTRKISQTGRVHRFPSTSAFPHFLATENSKRREISSREQKREARDGTEGARAWQRAQFRLGFSAPPPSVSSLHSTPEDVDFPLEAGRSAPAGGAGPPELRGTGRAGACANAGELSRFVGPVRRFR
jgi:hypothetical protein